MRSKIKVLVQCGRVNGCIRVLYNLTSKNASWPSDSVDSVNWILF